MSCLYTFTYLYFPINLFYILQYTDCITVLVVKVCYVLCNIVTTTVTSTNLYYLSKILPIPKQCTSNGKKVRIFLSLLCGVGLFTSNSIAPYQCADNNNSCCPHIVGVLKKPKKRLGSAWLGFGDFPKPMHWSLLKNLS